MERWGSQNRLNALFLHNLSLFKMIPTPHGGRDTLQPFIATVAAWCKRYKAYRADWWSIGDFLPGADMRLKSPRFTHCQPAFLFWGGKKQAYCPACHAFIPGPRFRKEWKSCGQERQSLNYLQKPVLQPALCPVEVSCRFVPNSAVL